MRKIIILNKKEGETPLEALEKFRTKRKAYKDVPMTYAGRLDPMATGQLLILAGDEVHNKEKYLALNKEYRFQVLFGFDTDTHDILGKVKHSHSHILKNIRMTKVEKVLHKFVGDMKQSYPMYSSKPVDGKPLFQHAREGNKVDIPERDISIYELELLKKRIISGARLMNNIEKRIKKIKGTSNSTNGAVKAVKDFRQEEILSIWKDELQDKKKEKFVILKFRVVCSSGAYVRVLAKKIGEELGVPALAFSIKRTKIMI